MFFSGLEDKHILKEFIQKNGFLVLKNALEGKDLEILPQLFGKAFEKNKLKFNSAEHLPAASHLEEKFSKLINSKKLISTLKKVCDGDLAYTSHSDLHHGIAGDWHKDDGKGKYFEGLNDYFTNKEVQVYKVGFYLQDCSKYGGLTIKKGSHLISNKNDGEDVYLPSKAGDAVIFDVRITHRGWLPNENIFFTSLKKIMRKIKIIESTPKVPFERKSVFFTYGSDNIYTKTFAYKNMERQNQQLGFDISNMPVSMKNSLRENNIKTYF